MGYEVRQADPAEGDKLLAFIEAEAAKGDLELIYTRRPNPVLSYQKEGRRVSFAVIHDENGVPCFMEVSIVRDCYFHGTETPFTYICGVRKRPGDKNHANMIRAAFDYEMQSASAGFCSILDANKSAARIFCGKTRRFFPNLSPLCRYTTFLINPRILAGRANPSYAFAPVGEDDLREVYSFLEREGKRYEMFPVVKDIEGQFSGLLLSDCFVLRKGGELTAFGALWDQKHYRQYIVRHYGGLYRYLRKAARLVEKIGFVYLPPEGETANVLTLTLVSAKDGDRTAYGELISGLAKEAVRRGCPILAAGMSRNNRYYPLYRRIRAIRFDSTVYTAEKTGNRMPVPDPAREIHLEVGCL